MKVVLNWHGFTKEVDVPRSTAHNGRVETEITKPGSEKSIKLQFRFYGDYQKGMPVFDVI